MIFLKERTLLKALKNNLSSENKRKGKISLFLFVEKISIFLFVENILYGGIIVKINTNKHVCRSLNRCYFPPISTLRDLLFENKKSETTLST